MDYRSDVEVYHEIGDIAELEKGVYLTVIKSDKLNKCKDCALNQRVDCFDIPCNYDQRADREDIIFKLKKL